MIELEIRDVVSPHVDENFEPQSRAVYFALEIAIGVRGEEKSDAFHVVIATPEGLAERPPLDDDGVVASRGIIVFNDFSWGAVKRVLQRVVDACAAEDWPTSVLRLQRYLVWEHEDDDRPKPVRRRKVSR